ncbi:hypothetical protein ACFSCX_08820 [Bacillus salitolerans]|uniref:MotA/TolQ/ExbB proton channel domain-containing protein n=1 Tax=Bacillus salitolerans TaxID=1437434 RepID=A0ABW4LNP1_9BACI
MEPSVIILFVIGFIAIFGVISHFQMLFTLKGWQQELIRLETSELGSSSVTWINRVVEEYRKYKEIQHESMNTISLVDKHFMNEPIRLFGFFKTPVGNVVRMQQLLPVACIICGILGTFLGLTLSMFSMQQTLSTIGTSTADISMSSIVSAISSPFQGMSLAFVTSIAGIASALLLNLFQTGFLSGGTSISYYQSSILAETESLLDHKVASLIKDQKPKDTLEKILDRFSDKVQDAFQKSVEQFAGKMVNLTGELLSICEGLNNMVIKQEEATNTFSTSTSTLKEFSLELSTSIESLLQVRAGVDSELQTLQQTIKTIEKQLQSSIEKQEAGQKRYEQMLQRSDQILRDSSNKTAEISNLFLKGLEEQMNRGFAKQEEMERRLYQKQEEWNYSLQDKQSQYYHAAQDFQTSVHQLEKAWHDVVERLRRDVIDKMEHARNRQSPLQNDNRELIRTIELASERSKHEIGQIQQYLTEVYQILLRMYEEQQYATSIPKRNAIQARIHE